MLSTLGLTETLVHYLWTIEVTVYIFWVLNNVVLMLVLRSVH